MKLSNNYLKRANAKEVAEHAKSEKQERPRVIWCGQVMARDGRVFRYRIQLGTSRNLSANTLYLLIQELVRNDDGTQWSTIAPPVRLDLELLLKLHAIIHEKVRALGLS